MLLKNKVCFYKDPIELNWQRNFFKTTIEWTQNIGYQPGVFSQWLQMTQFQFVSFQTVVCRWTLRRFTNLIFTFSLARMKYQLSPSLLIIIDYRIIGL